MKKFSFIIETIGGLCIFWVVNWLFFKANPGFIGIVPHPYLYLLVLITIRYGYARGIFCLLAVTISYLIPLLTTEPQWKDTALNPLATFVILLTLVGIITDIYRGRIKKSEEQNSALTRITGEIKEERDKLQHMNEELSQRLMAEKSTFAILYRTARKLSILEIDPLLAGIIELVDKVIGANNCAIFFLDGQNLVLRKAKNRETIKPDFPGHEIINQVLKEKKSFSIKDMVTADQQSIDEVFLCGPLLTGSGGEAAGIILAQGLDFIKYNPTTVRIFTLICDWASIAYNNALLYNSGAPTMDPAKLIARVSAAFNGIFTYGTGADKIREGVDKVCAG